MNIVILDNFDSFTYNLRAEFEKDGNTIHIWRNSMPAPEFAERIHALKKPRLLVLSPGPGSPSSAGSMIDVIKRLKGQVPMFGVCLGHQAMIEAFGGVVGRASHVVHGKSRILEHDGTSIFRGFDPCMFVGRYHSLCGLKIPDCFRVTATSENTVMAIEHRELPLIGIQFHPESILTAKGSQLIENVMAWAKEQV